MLLASLPEDLWLRESDGRLELEGVCDEAECRELWPRPVV